MTVSWGRRLIASLLSALVSAVVTHVGMLLVLLVGQQLQAQSIWSNHGVFLPGSLIVLVLVFAVAIAGGLRYWAVGFGTGLVAGFGAALVSLLLNISAAGTPVTADVVGQVIAQLLGYMLVFALVAAIVTATLGRIVYDAATGHAAADDDEKRRVAIVRMPSVALAGPAATGAGTEPFSERSADAPAVGEPAGLDEEPADHGQSAAATGAAPAETVIEEHAHPATADAPIAAGAADVDGERLDQQWDAYVQAIEAAGWATTEASFADRLPESVFVGDVVAVFGGTAVLTRPADDRRREETDGAENAVADLGLRVERIMSPGTVDGADIVTAGSTVYVGRGAGTNADGIRQLRGILTPLGYDVVAVPLDGAAPLTRVAAALADGTVLVSEDAGVAPGFFGRALVAPEPYGAGVLALGDTVVVPESAPRTAALVADLGYTVVTVDVSEFEKLGRGVASLAALVR